MIHVFAIEVVKEHNDASDAMYNKNTRVADNGGVYHKYDVGGGYGGGGGGMTPGMPGLHPPGSGGGDTPGMPAPGGGMTPGMPGGCYGGGPGGPRTKGFPNSHS